MIGARVVALAMFAARYKEYIALVCGVHWFLMFVWIISMRTTFCDNRCEELGYNAVLGVMFIFCYFNPVDSPTRYRYSFFYSFMFLENTLLMTLFFIHPDSIHSWYRLPAMIGHFLAFFLGIAFMVIFFLFLLIIISLFTSSPTPHLTFIRHSHFTVLHSNPI